jgi:hypothetical protein
MESAMKAAEDKTIVCMGYCDLCRQEEIKRYGTLVEDHAKHVRACLTAKCEHPALYTFQAGRPLEEQRLEMEANRRACGAGRK